MKCDFNDLVGQKFGKLTVVKYDGVKHHKKSNSYSHFYICQCECGNITRVGRGALKCGRSKSCGCSNPKHNIIGKKFGRLAVISLDHKVQRYKASGQKGGYREFYNCLCDCGNTCIVEKWQIISGNTKSCGCYRIDKAHSAFSKHNLTNHRLYNTWCKIKGRCYNTLDAAYNNYGGRGITMCKEWKNDFKAFYDWSMANGYKEDLTIDRIDVNGDYEPNNCRWATLKEQANNKRDNFNVTIYNRTQTLSEWCEEKGLNYTTVLGRIQNGWTIEDAFTK